MTKKQWEAIEYIKGVFDDLWIIKSTNKVLKMDYDAGAGLVGVATITITEGNYTTAELQTHLETLLDAAFADLASSTVAYSTATNKWTISADTGEEIKYVDSGSTAGDLLGFTEDQNGENIISDTQVYTHFVYAGYFPDDVKNIGNKYPAVLVGEGDEDYILSSGSRIEETMAVNLYLYHNVIIDRIETIIGLQNDLINTMLKQLCLGGYANNVIPLATFKGVYSENPDKYTEGYYPNLTVRRIAFELLIYDTRS